MKYLRKFDSVQGLNTAAANAANSFIGLAYNNGSPVIKNKVVPPQPNDEIWYTTSDGYEVPLTKETLGRDVSFGTGIEIISNEYINGKGIVKLSGNATIIDDYAFYHQYLTSISIPNSVTYIGDNAFASCSELTSVTMSNSVITIYDAAFEDCTGLTSITIPNTVSEIGQSAFDGCTGLTSINIPNSVTSIGGSAFQGCTNLTSITIPNSVTTISEGAFSYCSGLTSITIPSGVTSIGIEAFYNCTGLTSITIPNTVSEIGQDAFYKCTGLTSITCLPTNPPSLLNTNVFNNTNDCPIYVPAGSVDTYKAANNWSTYASRIQAIQA